MATFAEVLDLARRALQAVEFERAEAIYRRLLDAAPEAAEPWHELGIVQLQTERPREAVGNFQRAIALQPTAAPFHANLGAAHRAIEQPREAILSFERAIQLGLRTAEMHNNLALAHKDAGHFEESLAQFATALRINPQYANGHFNRGNLLLDAGRVTEAVESYRRAVDLKPLDAGAQCKLGVAWYFLGRLDEAMACYEQALRVQPNYPEARRNRALAWLARGDMDRGWDEYEWRFECDDQLRRRDTHRTWDGSPLAGRTLLVYAEQGLGDTLQFIRYIPSLSAAEGQVLVDMQKPLVELLKTSGYDRWLVTGSQPDADVACPLLSLPRLLAGRVPTPYWNGPYLHAEPARQERWRQRLGSIAGFKVGIVWAGKRDHPYDRLRSALPADFAPLAAVDGVQLISLQKGVPPGELAAVATALRVVDLADELDTVGGAFMDTAAVMCNLDLVISIDTAIVHLAGGLGVPVWVPLMLSPDWRWQLHGSHSAWYPTMRLFRQREFGGWPAVFAAMAEELRILTQSRGP